MKNALILLAGGTGKRFSNHQKSIPKQSIIKTIILRFFNSSFKVIHNGSCQIPLSQKMTYYQKDPPRMQKLTSSVQSLCLNK